MNLKKICIGSFVLIFIVVASFFIFERAFAGLCSFDPQAWGGGGYVGGQEERADKNCNQATSDFECSTKSVDGGNGGCVWDEGGGGGESVPIPPVINPEPETCNINSFTADSGNTKLTNNTGTTLHYSLTMTGPNPFLWNITLQGGGTVLPSPYSGTNISGTSSTGNLTQSQTYRLSCGDATPLDVTVLVSSPPEICQDRNANNNGAEGSCTYTTTTTCQDRNANNFGGTLPCTYPAITAPNFCTTPGATNYGRTGDCIFTETCSDRNANNFGDAGTCTFPPICQESGANNYGGELPCIHFPPNTLTCTVSAPCISATSYTSNGETYVIANWVRSPACSTNEDSTTQNLPILQNVIRFKEGASWNQDNYFARPYTETAFIFPTPFSSGNYQFSLKLHQWSSKSVLLTFPCLTHTLAINKAGTGSGTVTSSPDGINCGTTCSATFGEGTTPSVIARADLGSSFTGWSDDCSGQGVDPDHKVSVLMDANKTCTATFISTQQKADGFIDSANCSTMRGWAWDPDFKNDAISVNIYDNGVFFSTIPAGDHREDLPGNHKHAFTIPTPDAFKTGTNHTINFYAMDLNGDGNPNLSGSPVTLNCPAIKLPSGTISATGCSIPGGQSTCDSFVTWNTEALTSGRTEVTRNNPPIRVSLSTSDTNVRNTVNYGTSTFFLTHNINGTPTPLASAPMTAECASGTIWDISGICKSIGLSGTLTPEKPSCDIPEGRSDCPINFSWDTQGTVPGGTISAVTTDYPSANTHVSIPDANSGNGVPFTIKYDIQTFYLYNTHPLAESKVTALCIAGTEWKGGKCTKIPIPGCLNGGVLPYCCANGANNLACDPGGKCLNGGVLPYCCANGANNLACDPGGKCLNGGVLPYCCPNGANNLACDPGGKCLNGGVLPYCCPNGANNLACDINRIPKFKEN